MKDTIGRRDRYNPTPSGTKYNVQDSDVKLLHFNHIHGGVGLPTSYLFHAGLYTDYNSFEKRMVILRHELGLFTTGAWQKRTENPRQNCLINQNTKAGDDLLKARGLWTPYTPKKSGAHFHDTYMSMLYGSFAQSLPFTHQHEILSPIEMKDIAIELEGYTGRPDAIFKVQANGKDILCFLEADRATEPVRSITSTRRSWEPKIKFYRSLIGHGKYKTIFNHSGPAILLIATVSDSNAKNILSVVKEQFGTTCNYMMTQAHPAFGYDFHPPKGLIDITEWERMGTTNFTFGN